MKAGNRGRKAVVRWGLRLSCRGRTWGGLEVVEDPGCGVREGRRSVWLRSASGAVEAGGTGHIPETAENRSTPRRVSWLAWRT